MPSGNLLKGDGLMACLRLGYDSVIVLGHPAYYPKFGFKPAGKWGIKEPFGAPADAFMALELMKEILEGAGGLWNLLKSSITCEE